MPSYQNHLLFGSVVVLVFVLLAQEHLAYGPEATVAAAAFIMLASIFPDVDHGGSVVHTRLQAMVTVLVGVLSAALTAPALVQMVVAGAVGGVATYFLFDIAMPRHRGVTHTVRFGALFSLVAGVVSVLAFGTAVPGLFAFLAYLSHIVLDRFWTE